METNYRRWSEYPYPGEQSLPKGLPQTGEWPMFFITKEQHRQFFDPFHQQIHWNIQHPNMIDWETELLIVEQTLRSLTPQQMRIVQYWGTGELVSKIKMLIFHLAKKYQLSPMTLSTLLNFFQAAVNDVFVMSSFFKYFWDAARPIQYDPNLPTLLVTPHSPSYPSAHAALAGCTETLLNHFFPLEFSTVKRLMDDMALSRLYAGVHFKADITEGMTLGKQIGKIIITLIKTRNISVF
ncbi:phosphatase PAP2 family protein [Pseudobacillus wudalianchiensis]|uniref:Phosphatidic acid phosphatase type 2/haloperoxidase domain-containing protein n=1 Tax=Pseudobacillus wudalianchiensis TaxID=1743143 RepID=A0A1B9BA23_9BACI|nr:phosphatase PAP2 family protein [Bacillus wudalianchiensis]OCA92946.1 hypothetical protein A8F95_04485 [Bacillus wudalianchiensis]